MNAAYFMARGSLSQENFQIMVEIHQTCDALTKPEPWLCCSSSEFLIDYYLCRHCKNRLMESITSLYSGGNVLRTRVENNALQNAMQKLSPEQRCVVVLEIIKGFSNEDEADLLAKSIGTVKNTRNRALLILIHLLYSEYDLVYT